MSFKPGRRAAERARVSTMASVALLVTFNALPLVGVLFWGWDMLTILVLYWIESGIIGVVTVAKMARAEGTAPPPLKVRTGTAIAVSKAALITFFAMHYGIFWVVHGAFVFALPLFAGAITFGSGAGPADRVGYGSVSWDGLVLAAVGLAISHAAAYRFDIGRGVDLTRSPGQLLLEPYPRVIVLHLTVILGAVVVLGLGEPVLLIAFMVVLKTAIDLALLLFGRWRAGRALASPMGTSAPSSGTPSTGAPSPGAPTSI